MDQLGDYRLLEELATGSTGRVFAAGRWPMLSGRRLLALKVLNDGLAHDERFIERLRDGGQRSQAFEHPGAVAMLDVPVIGANVVAVSDLVDGQPLHRVLPLFLNPEAKVDPVLSLWLVRQLSAVLVAAHAQDLVHGYLAPDQVLISYEGEVRLIGLGLGEARSTITVPDLRRPFLAPEVLRTGVATAASDVHGLARLLHHGLSGARSVLTGRTVDTPAWLPPIRSYGVNIHPALEALVEAMLESSPKARPPLEEVDTSLGSAVSTRAPAFRNQLARLMHSAFTSEIAAAKLRRRRAASGDDEADAPDDSFVPRLESRTINPTGPHRTEPRSDAPIADAPVVDYWQGAMTTTDGTDRIERLQRRSFDASRDPRTDPDPLGAAPAFRDDLRVEPWTGPSWPPREDVRVDVEDPVEDAPPVRVGPDGRADPRLEALESGDEADLDALVDAIVRQSAPPLGPTTVPSPPPRMPAPASGGAEFPPDTGSLPPFVGRPVGSTERAGIEPEDEPPEPDAMLLEDALPPPDPPPNHDQLVYGLTVEPEQGQDVVPPEALFSEDVPRLPPGTVLGERYKIEDVIGEGGVSVVYRGSHSFLRKDVAIKVLRPELATMPPVVERFHREARSVAQLDHPNIVRVIDFGKSPSGSLFLVMDLIEGVSLAEQIEREGWLAPTRAMRIVVGILTGLEHAHGRGVIHRDLKPDNIMIVGPELGPTTVKILDFGIAKLGDVEIGNRPLTEAGMVFGTPRYMSPEQAAGEPVDHRSDLFTVGIILYQLLSGQLPFDGDTTVQILRRVLTQPAPRLRVNGLPSATSEALADVVARALAKSSEERYPTARTMREALQACFPL